jgi:hypothetical protein
MTQEEFDLEYPHGSLKRQEKIAELERVAAESQVAEENTGSDVPESVWRGNA